VTTHDQILQQACANHPAYHDLHMTFEGKKHIINTSKVYIFTTKKKEKMNFEKKTSTPKQKSSDLANQ
jgi:hypothetical protein